MINTSNIDEARKLISKEGKPKIVVAKDYGFNKSILEQGKFDILLYLYSENSGKNTLRQISSGFNHVLARIATKKGISIGFDLSELRELGLFERGEQVSKIIQNIKVARKAKTKIKVLNYNDKLNAKDFLISLGASTEQVKDIF